MRLGSQVGQTAGPRVYSQAMENEADHPSLLILTEAGHGPKDASHSDFGLLNGRKSVRLRSDKARLLYERSYPGSRARIQELVATEEIAGQPSQATELGRMSPIEETPFNGFADSRLTGT